MRTTSTTGPPGGQTNLDNLLLLCSFHHHLVHEGGFGVEVHDGKLRFLARDGTPITGVRDAHRAQWEDLTEMNLRRGLHLTAETCIPRYAGDRMDLDIAVAALLWDDFGPAASRAGPDHSG